MLFALGCVTSIEPGARVEPAVEQRREASIEALMAESPEVAVLELMAAAEGDAPAGPLLWGLPYSCPPQPDPRRDPIKFRASWPWKEDPTEGLAVGGVWWFEAVDLERNDQVALRACHKHPGQDDSEGVCGDVVTAQLLPEPEVAWQLLYGGCLVYGLYLGRRWAR